MKQGCPQYDPELIGRFVDGELTGTERDAVSRHLEECLQCRKTVQSCERMSHTLSALLEMEASSLPETVIEENVLSGINEKEKTFLFNLPHPAKLYLQTAFIIVIMIVGGTFYMKYPAVAPTPSAIVNYVEGDAASVMIFETENEKHTVIWYTET